MNLTKKIISYIFPLTRKIKSDFNGNLEVTVSNGRKVLDSANANYSYGSLQRILKFAFAQLDFTAVDTVLLLGLGGGSAVATLRLDFNFTGRITAVDIDPVVIQIAQEEFGVIQSENLEIVCADAYEFIRKPSAAYDLIIVDLFIDNRVPDKFLSAEFWGNIRRQLSSPSHIIFNTMSKTAQVAQVKAELGRLGLEVQEFAGVERTNTVLLAGHR